MSEQQGLEATIRDALEAALRDQDLADGNVRGWACEDACERAAAAVGAWLVGDEQVTRAAQAMFAALPRSDAFPAPRWEDEPQEVWMAMARVVLGALVQGDTP